ncbi:MAG: hypothetical protein PHP06_05925 [Clostridia bacterium]|nr:hypothetical protein [Clostridia bacterium]
MQEDENTRIQQIPEGFMLKSSDFHIIEQYRAICGNEGETNLEKCGIFHDRRRVEQILNKIYERPILWGQDPHNRFMDA